VIQRSDQQLRTSRAGTLVWFLVWPFQTLGVSSSNFSATPKKATSINSCINLSTIHQSEQELMTYWAGTLVGPDKTPPASLDDFILTPRKQAFWNSCKNLSTIQRSDQELRTYWADSLVWSLLLPYETVLVSSSNFSATPRQTTFRNSYKNLRTIQRSDHELRTSGAGTLVWSLVLPE
jgi:hypothetical protein